MLTLPKSMVKRVLTTARLMAPIAHFSHGVRVGSRIHIGAEAGTDPQKRLVGETRGIPDMTAQAERLFDNFEIALSELDGSLKDVVRFRAWVTDWRDAPAFETVRRRRLGERAACVTIGSWGFPLPHATVEAELIAVAGGDAGGQCWGAASGGSALDALARMAADLAPAGLKPRDVITVNVSLADLREAALLESAWSELFPEPGPARTVIVTSLGGSDTRVQLEWSALPGGGAPIGPNAVFAGEELYIGGQTGAGEGAEAQTVAVWQRMTSLLASAGMSRDDVVRTCNTLVDWRDYATYNAGYGRFVARPYPPRATVLGVLPVPGARIQMDAIAHRAGRDALTLEANPLG